MNTSILSSRSDLDQWWRSAVIYQVYPRSFADSNGDGIGDIPGIISRLDYLQKLGIDAIWMSPHYPSPQADNGYDVSDYFDVNPEYGTLDDFDELVKQARERNIRMIIDLVPNHCSIQHQWFQDALVAGPNSKERERFIFRYSKDGCPNNWGSMFGGPAWEQVYPLTGNEEDRDWWYLHLFAPEQPDFNWKHPDVHQLFKDFLHFWAQRGVSGFRVDVAHSLVKAEGLPDDDIGPDRWNSDKCDPESSDSGPFFDQDPVHDIYREWRGVLDEYGKDRMMVAEAWVEPPSRNALYVREDEMSQAFNFDYLKVGWFPDKMRDVINQTVHEMSQVGAPVTWVLSNHDVVRHPTRFGYEPGYSTIEGIGVDDPQPNKELGFARGRAISLFTLGLPGSVYLYQGEELGLPEVTDLPDDARKDPTWLRTNYRVRGRDGCRVPLPWNSSEPHAGFGGKPWLPQPDDWKDFAPDRQEFVADSSLTMYRKAIALRAQRQLGKGSFTWSKHCKHPQVLCVENDDTLVVLNMSDKPVVLEEVSMPLIASAMVMSNQNGVTMPGNSAAWFELKTHQ
ncbi:MAG: glycoside hydrolase family 13 protein [Actinomycetaceae bacterium]|nr:glycoside hydrolase family 13 protein [Actinomycetaceae bacterium]